MFVWIDCVILERCKGSKRHIRAKMKGKMTEDLRRRCEGGSRQMTTERNGQQPTGRWRHWRLKWRSGSLKRMRAREMEREHDVGVLGTVLMCEVSQRVTREAHSPAALKSPGFPALAVNSLKLYQFFILITLPRPADRLSEMQVKIIFCSKVKKNQYICFFK